MIDLTQYKADVAKLRATARDVASLYIERMQAYADERAAAATLLEWVLAEIGQALPVIGGEIKPWGRGVGIQGGPVRDGSTWKGDRLVLFIQPAPSVPCSFAKIVYSGPADVLPVGDRLWLTVEETVAHMPVQRLMRSLQDRLLEELDGDAADRRDDAEERTRKLRAVLELIA